MKEAVSSILQKKEDCWGCLKCSASFQNSTGFYYHAAGCLPEMYVRAPFIRRVLGLPPLSGSQPSRSECEEAAPAVSAVAPVLAAH